MRRKCRSIYLCHGLGIGQHGLSHRNGISIRAHMPPPTQSRFHPLHTCPPPPCAVPSEPWPDSLPLSLPCPPSPLSADATLALEAALSPGEAADFPVLWRGDWRQYAHVYMSEIVRRHMGGKRK